MFKKSFYGVIRAGKYFIADNVEILLQILYVPVTGTSYNLRVVWWYSVACVSQTAGFWALAWSCITINLPQHNPQVTLQKVEWLSASIKPRLLFSRAGYAS